MRVIGGVLGGRRLTAPIPTGVRPTPDMAREAIFNSLFGMGLPAGATVVDAYAGTGAMGIEALSRGARHVTFVDANPRACDGIEANLAMLRKSSAELGSTDVRCADVLTYLARGASLHPHADVVFADPPFADADWPALLERTNADVVVAEWNGPLIDVDAGRWNVLRVKRYGAVHVTVLARADASPLAARSAGQELAA